MSTSPRQIRQKASHNRTIHLGADEVESYKGRLVTLSGRVNVSGLRNKVVNQDLFAILDWLPESWVDLLFIDPPYNLTKSFNSNIFTQRSTSEYQRWLESWFPKLVTVLKPTATVYICGDWRSSTAIHLVAEKYLKIRNRITWEREKGRGALRNWKNCSEDIWFCTVSDEYYFDLNAVKLNRRVLAPYTNTDGKPKDWEETDAGRYRSTHPSNLWTDLTVPFWSMPENTDHPTQKPEKLLAKLVLASSRPGDFILDPFSGSGTACAVAKKLNRIYTGIEIDTMYCCTAEKRLDLVNSDTTIQGYTDGVFWDRNSGQDQKVAKRMNARANQIVLPTMALLGAKDEE